MNITEPLSAKAREMPDCLAVLTAAASLSYGELDRAVSWTVKSFKEAGLAPGDFVGIYLSNQTQHLITSLALARLGAGQFAFDDRDPPGLLRALARRLKVVATVANRSTKFETQTPRVDPPADTLRDFKGLKPFDGQANQDSALPFLVLRSSGTTGNPKLALLTLAAALARLGPLAHALPDGPGCRFLPLTDVSYFFAKSQIFRCLTSGGCLVLPEGLGDVHALVEFVAEHRVNYIAGIPAHAHDLLMVAKEDAFLFPGVDAFRLGSTLIPNALRRDIQEGLTPNLFVGYGSNEFGVVSIAPPALVRNIPGVVGKVVPGMKAEVVDDRGNPLPSGRVGKLRLKSAGTIDGNLDDPVETARVFRDGWFYSDDLAEFTPNGELIHHGRVDDLMILDGINIYPAEIEDALLQHEKVAEAAAFPIPSKTHGDIPAAAVVVRSPVSVEELLSYCRSLLGRHSPSGLKIVHKLPRNATGKVQKTELARLFRLQTDNTKERQ